MRQAHGYHDNTPKQHDDRDEDAGSEAFQQDVGQRFKAGVGDEEDGEACVVLASRDMQTRLESIEFGIANIRSVEEADEVEEAEPGNEAEVELP